MKIENLKESCKALIGGKNIEVRCLTSRIVFFNEIFNSKISKLLATDEVQEMIYRFFEDYFEILSGCRDGKYGHDLTKGLENSEMALGLLESNIFKGLAIFSNFLKGKIEMLLPKVLCAFVERMSSQNYRVRRSAIVSLRHLSLNSGYNSISEIFVIHRQLILDFLTENVDSMRLNTEMICALLENQETASAILPILPTAAERISNAFNASLAFSSYTELRFFHKLAKRYLLFAFCVNKALSVYLDKKSNQDLFYYDTSKLIEENATNESDTRKTWEESANAIFKSIENEQKAKILAKEKALLEREKLKKALNAVNAQKVDEILKTDMEEEITGDEEITILTENEKKNNKMVSTCLKTSLTFISSKSLFNKNLTLEIAYYSIKNLTDDDDTILPVVAEIWPMIKPRFDERNVSTLLRALKTLCVMFSKSGRFLKSRFERELWPILRKTLSEYKIKRRFEIQAYKATLDYNLAEQILLSIYSLLRYKDVVKNKIREIAAECVKFLSEGFYKDYDELVLSIFRRMCEIDGDSVWWVLNNLQKENKKDNEIDVEKFKRVTRFLEN